MLWLWLTLRGPKDCTLWKLAVFYFVSIIFIYKYSIVFYFKNIYNMRKKFFNILKNKIFTPKNISKFFIIFVFGFVSRAMINAYFEINVFTDFLHYVSILYYSFMSFFVVMVHEFFNFNFFYHLFLIYSVF